MPSQLTFNYGKTLTICISARNNVLYVKQQLQKLALLDAAILERIEIIIVDNDSTDGTSNTAKLFEGRVPFHYVSNTENLSQDNSFTFALNQAISTRSKYIWLLDARNVVSIEHFLDFVDLLEQNEAGLVYLSSNESARKPYIAYVDADDFLQTVAMGIIDKSRNIIRTDMIRGYNPKEFGAGTGIPAVPLFLHLALTGKQNFVYNRTVFDAGDVNFLAESNDPVRAYVKNILTIYDRYEDKPTSISPYTTMKMKSKVSDFMFPVIIRLFVLRRSVKGVDGRISRAIVKQNLGWRPAISLLKRCFSRKLWGRIVGFIFGLISKLFTFLIAIVVMLVCNTLVMKAHTRLKNNLATFRFRHRVRVGAKCAVQSPVHSVGNKYIYIGSGFSSKPGLRLECINTGNYTPKLNIGDDVTVDRDVCIKVIRDVKIGNRVMIGANVLITDFQYGKTDLESLHIPPSERLLATRGSVVIEDNVLIGPRAVIMQGITIGKGAVIGAGAVVTHSVPPFSVAMGAPARIKGRSI